MGFLRWFFGIGKPPRQFKPLPNETHAAPTFKFRLDNASHQNGYHIHLYKQNNGAYSLTNIVFSRIGKQVFAFEHCEGKANYKYRLKDLTKRKMIKNLKSEGLLSEIKKNKQWTIMFPKKREYLFDL